MSQNDRLVRHFTAGRSITPAQARSQFGVRNLRARVNELRSEGYCVYTNRTKTGTSYRMGKPNREIVSIAYSVAGSAVFGN